MYSVKESFYTLQGEGAQSGRAAVFCRFAGCNLWSGREEDRADAACRFCDTDFVGTDGLNGGKYSALELATLIRSLWDDNIASQKGQPYVVFTGGEPLLQLDADLVAACHDKGFEIAIESNGTLPVPNGVDWVCISPKGTTEVVVTSGNELKLVYPQTDALPVRFEDMDFDYFYLQPMAPLQEDADVLHQNTQATLDYCRQHPQWRLSQQSHKLLNIP